MKFNSFENRNFYLKKNELILVDCDIPNGIDEETINKKVNEVMDEIKLEKTEIIENGNYYKINMTLATNNSKLDKAFPYLSKIERLKIRLEPISYYSLTPFYAAKDMNEACVSILSILSKKSPENRIAVDLTAGAGGNSLAFINYKSFSTVISIECDSSRCLDLEYNLALASQNTLANWKVINQDCNEWIKEQKNDTIFDLIFIDPPFGGQDYTSQLPLKDYLLGNSQLSFLMTHELTFSGILSKRVKLCAVKVPIFFDPIPLFSNLTKPHDSWEQDSNGLDERPHPFQLQFGHKLSLLLVAYPPFACNALLDDIIRSLVRFDQSGGLAFHPKYYDWEAKRLISLKRWKFKS